MVRKVRELANFAYHSRKKKYWGICLEELEKEEKVSLYQADNIQGLPGSREQVSLGRIMNCPT